MLRRKEKTCHIFAKNYLPVSIQHPTPRIPYSYSYSYCLLLQKASSGDISGTKRGIIDPLVSKRLEKILNKTIRCKKNKFSKNGPFSKKCTIFKKMHHFQKIALFSKNALFLLGLTLSRPDVPA